MPSLAGAQGILCRHNYGDKGKRFTPVLGGLGTRFEWHLLNGKSIERNV